MKKLAVISLVLSLVVALGVAATAQQKNPVFTTTASKDTAKPGETIGIEAIVQDITKFPALASRDCYFLVGFWHGGPKRGEHFVWPPLLIAKARFTKVVQKNVTQYVAQIRFKFPDIKLPPELKIPVFFQAVAAVKSKSNQTHYRPAAPDKVILSAGD